MNKRRRILIFITRLQPGGAERAVIGFANAFKNDGWDVYVYCGKMVENWRNGLDKDVNLICYNTTRRLFATLHLARGIFTHKPDILFSFMMVPSMMAFLAKMLSGKSPDVWISHGTPVEDLFDASWKIQIKRRLVHGMYRKADSIVATSPGTMKDILSVWPALSARTVVCPNPLTAEEFPLEPGNSKPEFDLLIVSRLDRNKNVQRVLRIFAEVLKLRPDATLAVAGDGPDRDRLEGIADTLGLGQHVTFFGFVDDVKSLYRISKCFVLLSRQEEFGMVYVEAMRSGLVIMANSRANGPRFISSLCPSFFLLDIDQPDAQLAKITHDVLSHAEKVGKETVIEESRVFLPSSVFDNYLHDPLYEGSSARQRPVSRVGNESKSVIR